MRKIAHNIRLHAHAVWLCARDAEVAPGPKLLALAIAAYALSPIDLIPDFIPVLGLVDEAVLIPLGIALFRKLVPAALYARNLEKARASAARPVSRMGAAIVVSVWLAAGWAGYLLMR